MADCKKFKDWLIRKIEHLDQDLVQDRFPTDSAWPGHVATGQFKSYDGVSHTYNRTHVTFPDISERFTDVQVQNCAGAPCDPPRKKICFGSTQFSYHLVEQAWATDLWCFENIQSADQAREEYANFVKGMRQSSDIINANHIRFEALAGAETIYVAKDNGFTEVTIPALTDTITLNTGADLPTSKLRMEHLRFFEEDLILEGYFNDKNEKGYRMGDIGKFKFITDRGVVSDLTNREPELASRFQITDFLKGGQFFKYGGFDGCGDFIFSEDTFPLRYQLHNAVLERIIPYVNTDATKGKKQIRDSFYGQAQYQLSPIWHPQAMQILGYNATSLIPEMPFWLPSYDGKWHFAMHDLVEYDANGVGCPVDNSDENKGRFQTKFRNAVKYVRPELVRWILHLREKACLVDLPPCAADPGYITQSYDSACDVCENCNDFDFDVLGAGPYDVTAITCNGIAVALAAGAAGSFATLAAIVVWLTANYAYLGTWTSNATQICLTGAGCPDVSITIETVV